MANEYEIKKQICDIGKRIYDRGMVAANDGNISVKLNDNEFLCTPTGVSKGFMTPEYICKVDANGNVLQANGNFKPSSEIKMHMRVYKHRPDVGSVVHAHPTFATAFAIAGIPLTAPIMPEAVIALGCVPIAEYGTPSTNEIPDAVEKYLPYYDAVLLENHGALSYSVDLWLHITRWSLWNFMQSFCTRLVSSAARKSFLRNRFRDFMRFADSLVCRASIRQICAQSLAENAAAAVMDTAVPMERALPPMLTSRRL